MTWSNDKVFRNPATGLFERIANRAEAPVDGVGQPTLPPDPAAFPFPVAERGGGFADANAFVPRVGMDSDGSGSGPVHSVAETLAGGAETTQQNGMPYAPRHMPGVPVGRGHSEGSQG